MNKTIMSLMLLAMLFIAGCSQTQYNDKLECFEIYAKVYCDSINQTFVSINVGGIFIPAFTCTNYVRSFDDDHRFKFTPDEKNVCNS